MTLQQWVSNGWLIQTEPTPEETRNAIQIAERELADASLDGISPDGRFEHAYNAVRSLCHAALHANGFQVPKGQRQHERVIESLKYTLGPDWSDDVDFFDQCRRMRHKSMYDTVGIARYEDATELAEAGRKLETAVKKWLADNRPHLL